MTEAVSAGDAGGSAGPRRASIAGRVAFYVLFAIVDVLAMSKEAFTMGLYLLVLPALVLAAVHWGFLLIPLVDWPLTAWRRTRSARLAAFWFCAALIVPVGVPATLNLLQATAFALDRMGDIEPKQAFAPAGPVLVVGDCGEVCADLFRSGTFTHLLHRSAGPPRDWRDGSVTRADLKLTSTHCPPRRRPGEAVSLLRDPPGWCIVTRGIEHPSFSAVIRLEGYEYSPTPRRRRIEIYACNARCRLIARQTERRGSRLATPLQIVYRGDSLYLDPQFRRVARRTGDADPARVIGVALGVPRGPGKPRLGEDPVWAAQAQTLQASEETLRRTQSELERRIRHARDRADELAAAQRSAREVDATRNRQQPCRPSQFDDGRTFGASCR